MSSPSSNSSATSEDPFRQGWRDVHEKTVSGEAIFRQITLPLGDLLFPQEGDHVMHLDPHARDLAYLREDLRSVLRDQEQVGLRQQAQREQQQETVAHEQAEQALLQAEQARQEAERQLATLRLEMEERLRRLEEQLRQRDSGEA